MNNPSRYAAFMGISLALMSVLSVADNVISSAFPVPGIRLGLSNVVIIAVLLMTGLPSGIAMSLLRSGFSAVTRGFTAGAMSLSGGLLSFAAAYLLICVLKRSYRFSCAVSSAVHIIGQMLAACIMTRSIYTLYYAPFLIPAGIITGIITGTIIEISVSRLNINSLFRKD